MGMLTRGGKSKSSENHVATVTLDDDLSRRVNAAAAAADGKTLDEFVGDVLRSAVNSTRAVRKSYRNGIPVLHVVGQWSGIDPDKVRRSIKEEGV